MKQYQKRVATEKRELDQKVKKLEKFLADPPQYKGPSKTELILMKQQLGHMQQYSRVLEKRVEGFQSC